MYIDGITIGRELKSIRVRNGLSGEDVARKIGVHINSLYKYERDASKMNISTFEKLLRAYNIDEITFFKTIREYKGLI